MTKILIAYHANCIDGFTSAYIAHKALSEIHKVGQKDSDTQPEHIQILPVTYGKLPALHSALYSQAYNFDVLFVVDFSLPVDTLAAIASAYPKMVITIIDHHKTAKEMYGDLEFCKGARIVMDMDESGATLTWKHFYGDSEDKMPALYKYVRDYDLWLFQFGATKTINMYLRTIPKTLYDWEMLELDFEVPHLVKAIVDKGLAMEKYHRTVVDSLVESADEVELAGQTGLLVNCSSEFASDVGHKLANISGTFGATWQQIRGDAIFSLRSNGDYDVAELAQKLGGGGHRNAAGFTLSTPQDTLFPDEEANKGATIWSTLTNQNITD